MEASDVVEHLQASWYTDEIERCDPGHEDNTFVVSYVTGERFLVTVAKVSE